MGMTKKQGRALARAAIRQWEEWLRVLGDCPEEEPPKGCEWTSSRQNNRADAILDRKTRCFVAARACEFGFAGSGASIASKYVRFTVVVDGKPYHRKLSVGATLVFAGETYSTATVAQQRRIVAKLARMVRGNALDPAALGFEP